MERFARVSIIFKLRLTNNNNQLIKTIIVRVRTFVAYIRVRSVRSYENLVSSAVEVMDTSYLISIHYTIDAFGTL